MSDTGYLWDEEKYELVRGPRQISLLGVVEALEDLDAHVDLDPQGHPGRYISIGRTKAGRRLAVIYSDEEMPVVRIITAYDPNEHWSKKYEEGRGN